MGIGRLGLSPARIGLLQVCLAGILWGTGGLGVQILREHEPMSVLTIIAWRMGLAALVLLAAVLLRREVAALKGLLREQRGRTVRVGVCTAAYQALYFGAVVSVGVTVATVISLGLAPVVLTVGEAVHARRAPDRGRVLVVVVALVGLLLVTGAAGFGETGPRPAFGVALATASGFAYALATVLGRSLAQGTAPLALTAATISVGAIVLVPLGLVGARGGAPLVPSDPVALITLVYLGVVTMALAYGLLYAGLRTTTGSAAVIATLLEPVTAALAAAAVLDERLGVAGVVGTVLVLAAVAGLARPEPPPALPP